MPGFSMACQPYRGLPQKILSATESTIKWDWSKTERPIGTECLKLSHGRPFIIPMPWYFPLCLHQLHLGS